MNGVLLQCFQWYSPGGGTLWQEISQRCQAFADAGITALWFPPAGKGAAGGFSVGYDVYDLFDLGEFNQKGTVPTKYGTKADLIGAVEAAHAAGLHVYADVVFNHKSGGDKTERIWAQAVDRNDRNSTISDWEQITAWTHFTFPGRNGKYSAMEWFWWCFDALDYNEDTQNADTLYRLKDKQFSTEVSHEHGNDDYLFANDLDMANPFVLGELRYWGEWFLDTVGVDGFRIDATKHIEWSLFPAWLDHLRERAQKELFSVGEYWSSNLDDLQAYIADSGRCMSLFDVPLHYNFAHASTSNGGFDMSRLLSGSLMMADPTKAVTFVDNHDTQPHQSLESPVAEWFKPLAYAVILLRSEGYPCVFIADYDGAAYEDVVLQSHRDVLDQLLRARQTYAYGDQIDYFDHWSTVGWTRLGNDEHPKALAVIMTDGAVDGTKWMNVGTPDASFHDLLGNVPGVIVTDEDGRAEFRCRPGSVSVWAMD